MAEISADAIPLDFIYFLIPLIKAPKHARLVVCSFVLYVNSVKEYSSLNISFASTRYDRCSPPRVIFVTLLD